RAELIARPPELAHGPAQRPAELRQVLRAEDDEGDDEDDDQLLEADVKHREARSRPRSYHLEREASRLGPRRDDGEEDGGERDRQQQEPNPLGITRGRSRRALARSGPRRGAAPADRARAPPGSRP